MLKAASIYGGWDKEVCCRSMIFHIRSMGDWPGDLGVRKRIHSYYNNKAFREIVKIEILLFSGHNVADDTSVVWYTKKVEVLK